MLSGTGLTVKLGAGTTYNMISHSGVSVAGLTGHCMIFLVLFMALWYNIQYIVIDETTTTFNYKGFAGKFKFLTFWNLCLQTLYFGLAVLNDLIGSNCGHGDHTKSRLQKIRDNFFCTIGFPIGTFVVLTFWGIYAIDRELVYPAYLDKIIPQWLNHVMHTTPIFFVMIESCICYHQFPSKKAGTIGIVGFAMIYQAWILWIAFYADIWVYPLLKVLDWPKKLVFFGMCWLLVGGIYLTGETITHAVWGKPQAVKYSDKPKSKKVR